MRCGCSGSRTQKLPASRCCHHLLGKAERWGRGGAAAAAAQKPQCSSHCRDCVEGRREDADARGSCSPWGCRADTERRSRGFPSPTSHLARDFQSKKWPQDIAQTRVWLDEPRVFRPCLTKGSYKSPGHGPHSRVGPTRSRDADPAPTLKPHQKNTQSQRPRPRAWGAHEF